MQYLNCILRSMNAFLIHKKYDPYLFKPNRIIMTSLFSHKLHYCKGRLYDAYAAASPDCTVKCYSCLDTVVLKQLQSALMHEGYHCYRYRQGYKPAPMTVKERIKLYDDSVEEKAAEQIRKEFIEFLNKNKNYRVSLESCSDLAALFRYEFKPMCFNITNYGAVYFEGDATTPSPRTKE